MLCYKANRFTMSLKIQLKRNGSQCAAQAYSGGGDMGVRLPPLDKQNLRFPGSFQAPTGSEPPWKQKRTIKPPLEKFLILWVLLYAFFLLNLSQLLQKKFQKRWTVNNSTVLLSCYPKCYDASCLICKNCRSNLVQVYFNRIISELKLNPPPQNSITIH